MGPWGHGVEGVGALALEAAGSGEVKICWLPLGH